MDKFMGSEGIVSSSNKGLKLDLHCRNGRVGD